VWTTGSRWPGGGSSRPACRRCSATDCCTECDHELRRTPFWRLAAAVAVAGLTAAVAAVAATPDDFGQLDERRAALLAALDFGGLPNSLAVAMLEDPFPQARAEAARVLASEADPARVALVRQYAGDADPWARSHAMVAAGRIGRPALAVALGGPTTRCRWSARPRVGACHGGEELRPDRDAARQRARSAVLEAALANL
jgi:hypothetical protein